MYSDILDKVRIIGLRRKLSPRTISTYMSCIKRFLIFIKDKPIQQASRADVKAYLEHLATKAYTGKTLNVHYCAVKFLMEEVLQRRRLWIPLKFSKEQKNILMH
jgi:site-specific recombinase XerD